MKTGAMDFKDESGQSLPSNMNKAVGRSMGAAVSGTGNINEADATTIKDFMAARGREGAEGATKKADRSAPITRRGGGTGGRSNRSKGMKQRATLLGDA